MMFVHINKGLVMDFPVFSFNVYISIPSDSSDFTDLTCLLLTRLLLCRVKAMLPESLVRSCSIILGVEAAEELKVQMQRKNFRAPSEATMSRFRLKLDATGPQIYHTHCNCIFSAQPTRHTLNFSANQSVQICSVLAFLSLNLLTSNDSNDNNNSRREREVG